MSTDSKKEHNQITSLQLFSMTTSMVMTVYGFAAFAKQGPHAFFFLFLAAVLWFLPVILSSGEMASIDGWEKGGVFTWVSGTLGEKNGWLALFYQWVHITVGINTMMYFIIGCFAASLNIPVIDSNPLIKFIVMMVILWGLIFLQQHGTKVTGQIAQWCFTIGVIIPVLILLVMFIIYLAQGHSHYVTINWHTIMPHSFGIHTLVGFVPFILAFAGAEGSAPHVKNLKNPKAYPKVMLALGICAVISDIVGSMAIAMTIPNDHIVLSNGIVFAFGGLLDKIASHGVILEKISGILLAIGVLGEISSWVVGPNTGMYEAAKKGFLPKKFSKLNDYGIPTNVMILQGTIVSIMGALLTFGAGGSKDNLSFRTAMSLTVAIYTLMYMMMFISYIVLQTKRGKNLVPTYNFTKYKIIKIIVGFLGFILSLLGFVVSFVPASELPTSEKQAYLMMLLVAFIIVLIVPFAMYKKHEEWKK
ncbi:amino acid permease [Enterococcus faecalis]|uniref:amino acid permease n=1 Tax=Enterococcus TaxID=1350 RepID=UPI00045A5013|nr:amino acid permease [Enterococcus faecalis]EGO2842930.1 amino acid permease [Enterococcus faecalis]KAJ75321.1 Glutamate gamma-aminobutyrate antiporter [Enterococcus faecalis MTUP9]